MHASPDSLIGMVHLMHQNHHCHQQYFLLPLFPPLRFFLLLFLHCLSYNHQQLCFVFPDIRKCSGVWYYGIILVGGRGTYTRGTYTIYYSYHRVGGEQLFHSVQRNMIISQITEKLSAIVLEALPLTFSRRSMDPYVSTCRSCKTLAASIKSISENSNGLLQYFIPSRLKQLK